MFLKKTLEKNEALVDCAVDLHKKGVLLPDTYVIDLDTLFDNARNILASAKRNDITLYCMLKQLGHNPYIAHTLCSMGFKGTVAVDFREALLYLQNNIPLGHVGHLVQIPFSAEERILASHPDIVTVFSLDKLREINSICKNLGISQNIMLRIIDTEDVMYAGQEGGFMLKSLDQNIPYMKELENIRVSGVTGFPCFLFNEKSGMIEPTRNVKTLQHAAEILVRNGFEIKQINMPSVNCVQSMQTVRSLGGTHAEPGHGLTGTTPLHAVQDCVEKPCLIYLTEVSHNYNGKAYCYGGGFYRRSHVRNAVTGMEKKSAHVDTPALDSIDYHFALDREEKVSETVIMAFRAQIFVTRSMVALIEGISKGNPRIAGIYTAEGYPAKN
jgi:predicted amino acid racemase